MHRPMTDPVPRGYDGPMMNRASRARQIRSAVLVLLLIASVVATVAATGTPEASDSSGYRIGVFVPGVVDGSPTYEMLVAGVQQATGEAGIAAPAIIEGGFNQASWEEGVTSMAASGDYDLIVTSNPSMPEIAANVAAVVPEVAFLVLDGYLPDNPRIHTVLFNQREQAFLSGYFAGLVTNEGMPEANAGAEVGLLAGQEYPIMNNVILPGYEEGLRETVPEGSVDFRVLGNWFDAGRAQEIVADMITQGSDVVLTIAGGGNQGAIAAARERDSYVLWYDDSGYDQAPGVVVGSSFVRQDRATYEATLAAINGELEFGQARVLGVADGAVSFDLDHPAFRANVPEQLRNRMADMLARMEAGEVALPMPGLDAN